MNTRKAVFRMVLISICAVIVMQVGAGFIHTRAQEALNNTAAESIGTGYAKIQELYAKIQELETELNGVKVQLDQVNTDRDEAIQVVKQLIFKIARLEANVIRLHIN